MRIRDRIAWFQAKRIAKRARAERARTRREFGPFFDEVSELLFRADPIGINFENNTDEYDAEAGTIIPRLRHCADADQVCSVVHEEFARWFSPADAGTRERYHAVSAQIWQAWQHYQGHRAV